MTKYSSNSDKDPGFVRIEHVCPNSNRYTRAKQRTKKNTEKKK